MVWYGVADLAVRRCLVRLRHPDTHCVLFVEFSLGFGMIARSAVILIFFFLGYGVAKWRHPRRENF
jgi:hypothetical protein